MKKIFSRTTVSYSIVLIIGLFMGWLIFHKQPMEKNKLQTPNSKLQTEVWTCSMHPQIKMDHPGACPICGMDLIPLKQTDISQQPSANDVFMSEEAIQLSNIMTSRVSKENPNKELRLYGKVKTNDELQQSQTAHISGRIEKLMVNFTGEYVSKGQTLALVYSPELTEAQQELIEALKLKNSQPEFLQAAREKLLQWKLTEKQIDNIEKSKKVQNDFEIKSNTTGVVIAKRVNTGDHISEGTIMFDIADLSRVWIMFDAYESDIAYIKKGDMISYKVDALPGKEFKGKVSFIDPVIDPETRVAKVRVEADNREGQLKPEMFVTGILQAKMEGHKDMIVIPSSSVLWTGKRSIVYVKESTVNSQQSTEKNQPGFTFEMREVELGPMLGNSYVILSGLKEGEEIVTNGTFNIDAAAQLEGKPSMMNR